MADPQAPALTNNESGAAWDIFIATIPFRPGYQLKVYPSRPGQDYTLAGPFRYEPPVRYEPPKQGHLFDKDRGTVSFSLEMTEPTDAQLKVAQDAILRHYRKAGTPAAEVDSSTLPVMVPLSVVGYRVEIAVNKASEVLVESGIDITTSDNVGTIKVTDRIIQNPEILRVLSHDPDAADIIFKPLFVFQLYDSEAVYATISRTFVNSITSQVLGSSPSGKYVVDRKAFEKLRSAMVNQQSYTVFGTTDPNVISLVTQKLDEFFKSLKEVSITDIAQTNAPMFVLNRPTLAKELSPEEYERLAKETQEQGYEEKVAESVIDNLVRIEKQNDTLEKWYNQYRDYIHTFGSFESSASASMLEMSGDAETSASIDFTKDYSSLTSGEKTRLERLRTETKNFANNKEKYIASFSKSFKGKDLVRGFQAKSPNFYIVSTAEILEVISVGFETFRNTSRQAKGPNVRLDPSRRNVELAKKEFVIYIQNNNAPFDNGYYTQADIHLKLEDPQNYHSAYLRYKDSGEFVLIPGVIDQDGIAYRLIAPDSRARNIPFDDASDKGLDGIRLLIGAARTNEEPANQLRVIESLASSTPMNKLIKLVCFYYPS